MSLLGYADSCMPVNMEEELYLCSLEQKELQLADITKNLQEDMIRGQQELNELMARLEKMAGSMNAGNPSMSSSSSAPIPAQPANTVAAKSLSNSISHSVASLGKKNSNETSGSGQQRGHLLQRSRGGSNVNSTGTSPRSNHHPGGGTGNSVDCRGRHIVGGGSGSSRPATPKTGNTPVGFQSSKNSRSTPTGASSRVTPTGANSTATAHSNGRVHHRTSGSSSSTHQLRDLQDQTEALNRDIARMSAQISGGGNNATALGSSTRNVGHAVQFNTSGGSRHQVIPGQVKTNSNANVSQPFSMTFAANLLQQQLGNEMSLLGGDMQGLLSATTTAGSAMQPQLHASLLSQHRSNQALQSASQVQPLKPVDDDPWLAAMRGWDKGIGYDSDDDGRFHANQVGGGPGSLSGLGSASTISAAHKIGSGIVSGMSNGALVLDHAKPQALQPLSQDANTFGKNILMPKKDDFEQEQRLGPRVEQIPQSHINSKMMSSSLTGNFHLGASSNSASTAALNAASALNAAFAGPAGPAASAMMRGGRNCRTLKPLDTDRSAPGRLEGGRLKKKHQVPTPVLVENDIREEDY